MNNEKSNGRGSIGSTPKNSWAGAMKHGPLPNHIHEMLVRYKDEFTNVLLKTLRPRNGKQLCSTRDWLLEVCGDKWSWWTDMRMVKEIQEVKWPLNQKKLRSLVCLANYNHHFIRYFSKVARTLLNLLKKLVSWKWDEPCHKPLGSSKASSLCKLWSSSRVFTSILRCIWRWGTLSLADVNAR